MPGQRQVHYGAGVSGGEGRTARCGGTHFRAIRKVSGEWPSGTVYRQDNGSFAWLLAWLPPQFVTQGSEVTFTCHHGPNECYGNKVHACAIEHIQANSYQVEYTRESLTMDFINCLMKAGKNFPDNVYPGQRCASENHINNWENIKTCANSTEGSVLLRKAGESTMRLKEPLTSVPTILFNEVSKS